MAISFDPSSSAFNDDPYPVYTRLRREEPVCQLSWEGRTYWLLSRYADIADATVRWQDYTATRGILIEDSPARVGLSLGTMDPPRHDELRPIFSRAFLPDRIRAAGETARDHARVLIEPLRQVRCFDLVADFAKPFFNRAIGRVIGIDLADEDELLRLLADVQSESTPFGAPIRFAALPALNAFVIERVGRPADGDGEDLISVLRSGRSTGVSASDGEIANAAVAVIMAGFSTAIHFLGNLLSALERHPEQRNRLFEDPSLAAAAIEEGARYDTAGHAFARSTTRALQIGDTLVPPEARVVLLYASANRDESVFPDADQFNLSRPKARHFGFGSGPHLCLGAPLARTLVKVALEELLPVIGADYELDYASATRPINISARGFDRLAVHRDMRVN
jgi:cytochrome P450